MANLDQVGLAVIAVIALLAVLAALLLRRRRPASAARDAAGDKAALDARISAAIDRALDTYHEQVAAAFEGADLRIAAVEARAAALESRGDTGLEALAAERASLRALVESSDRRLTEASGRLDALTTSGTEAAESARARLDLLIAASTQESDAARERLSTMIETLDRRLDTALEAAREQITACRAQMETIAAEARDHVATLRASRRAAGEKEAATGETPPAPPPARLSKPQVRAVTALYWQLETLAQSIRQAASSLVAGDVPQAGDAVAMLVLDEDGIDAELLGGEAATDLSAVRARLVEVHAAAHAPEALQPLLAALSQDVARLIGVLEAITEGQG